MTHENCLRVVPTVCFNDYPNCLLENEMAAIKRIVSIILWAALLILAAPLIILLVIPFILVSETKVAMSVRAFRGREQGHVYLICTSKHGWHDFLKNNVIPVVPGGVRVVWQKTGHNDEHPTIFTYLAHSRIVGVSKPYCVRITARNPVCKSLNPALRRLKTCSRKSPQTQQACAEVIERTLNELQ